MVTRTAIVLLLLASLLPACNGCEPPPPSVFDMARPLDPAKVVADCVAFTDRACAPTPCCYGQPGCIEAPWNCQPGCSDTEWIRVCRVCLSRSGVYGDCPVRASVDMSAPPLDASPQADLASRDLSPPPPGASDDVDMLSVDEEEPASR